MKTVIDPEGNEHKIPDADVKHFEKKEGWKVKGGAAPKKETTKKK